MQKINHIFTLRLCIFRIYHLDYWWIILVRIIYFREIVMKRVYNKCFLEQQHWSLFTFPWTNHNISKQRRVLLLAVIDRVISSRALSSIHPLATKTTKKRIPSFVDVLLSTDIYYAKSSRKYYKKVLNKPPNSILLCCDRVQRENDDEKAKYRRRFEW